MSGGRFYYVEPDFLDLILSAAEILCGLEPVEALVSQWIVASHAHRHLDRLHHQRKHCAGVISLLTKPSAWPKAFQL